MKKHLFPLLLIFPLGLAACEGGPGQPEAKGVTASEDSVAIVNGAHIPGALLSVYARGVPVTDDNREDIIDNVIVSHLIAEKAKTEGIDRRPEVQAELRVAEQAILGRVFAGEYLDEHPVTDEDVDERYRTMSEEGRQSFEYQVSHILVEEEETANELLTKIKEDPSQFEALAKAHSTDPGSGQQGGDLGWTRPEALVPEFSEAMVKLQSDEISEAPVKSQFGWHIIRVNDTRASKIPELDDELRERLKQAIQAERFVEYLGALREEADITINN